jgi:NAD(P)-dependent dehydrogenase (short-subunit alcohol dehydrogenase family)
MSRSFSISGKIIVITGGGSGRPISSSSGPFVDDLLLILRPILGIGFALVQRAHSSGANVIIADLKLSAESQEFVQKNANVHFTRCDVTIWQDLESLVSFSEQEFGDVPDVFAANAGVCSPVCISIQGGFQEISCDLPSRLMVLHGRSGRISGPTRKPRDTRNSIST